MLRILLPGLLLLTASCAQSPQDIARADAATAKDEARLAKALVGRSAGKPIHCIEQRATDMTNYGGALLYRVGAGRLYLNRPTDGCFGLKNDDILVTRSYSGQLCRGDILRTVDRTTGFPTGSCVFGDFTPYAKERS